MSKAIPGGLQREHALSAQRDLDGGIEDHPCGKPTRYELVHDSKRYPPKTAVGIAVKYLNGTVLTHRTCSGGERADTSSDLSSNALPSAGSCWPTLRPDSYGW